MTGLTLFVTLLAWTAPPQDPEDGRFHVEEVSESVLKQFDAMIEAETWRDLFLSYSGRLEVNRRRLCRVGGTPPKLISFTEWIIDRFSRLPRSALRHYRLLFDGRLATAMETYRRTGETGPLESSLRDFFYATGADVQIDALANQSFERGAWAPAARHWRRLLKYYPDPSVDLRTVAAKLIHCGQILRSEPLIEEARKLVAQRGLTGEVLVAGGRIRLEKFAAGARIDPWIRQVVKALPREPWLSLASEQAGPWPTYPTVEVRLGRYENSWGALKTLLTPFSIPAHANIGGRELLVHQDGVSLLVMNPERVRPGEEARAQYWIDRMESAVYDPKRKPISGSRMRLTMPLAGAVFDGTMLYVNMHSRETKPEPPNPQAGRVARLPAINSIRAYRLVDERGRLMPGHSVTSTDRAIFQSGQSFDFAEGRFHFSWPMEIVGDHLYVGAVRDAGGEQESYVVCFNKRTLDLVWWTYVCSAAVSANWWGGAQDPTVFPTMIRHHGGTLLVQTNLGAAAALDPETGTVLWLTPYKRAALDWQRQRHGAMRRALDRPPSPPAVHQNRLYILPMDSYRLLVFDTLTGQMLPGFELPSGIGPDNDFNWKHVTYLVGVEDNTVICSGEQGMIIHNLDKRLRRPTIVTPWQGGSSLDGLPTIHGRYVYVPVSGHLGEPSRFEGSAGLRVYDRRTWKLVDEAHWRRSHDWGNVVVFGNHLAIAGADHLTIWTSARYALRDLERMTRQTPADPEILFTFATHLLDSFEARPDRLSYLRRARKTFAKFLWLAGESPAYADQKRQARAKLYSIYTRLGDEAMRVADAVRAVEYYRNAVPFAFDGQSLADVRVRLAEAYTAPGDLKAACLEYLDVILQGRDAVIQGTDSTPALLYARDKITGLLKADPSLARTVEEVVRRVVDESRGSLDALVGIVERFPTTAGTEELIQQVLARAESVADPEKRLRILNRVRRARPDPMSFEAHLQLVRALEAARDYDRLKHELRALAGSHGSRAMEDPGFEDVKAWVAAMLKKTARLSADRTPKLGDELAEMAELGSPSLSSNRLRLPTARIPLQPGGVLPPALARNANRVLVRNGSSVELFDLERGTPVWTLLRPGPYMGILVQEDERERCMIIEVAPGSPGWRAGLRPGDWIRKMNGLKVTGAGFPEMFEALKPGAAVELEMGSNKTMSVTLGTVPPSARHPIVDAGFTSDYGLVVVWEDRAVGVDLETGQVRWMFDGVREMAQLDAAGIIDGYIVLFEKETRRGRVPYRIPSRRGRPAGQNHRLITLLESTGEMVHIEKLSLTPGEGNVIDAAFFGNPHGTSLGFLLRTAGKFHVGRVPVAPGPGRGEWTDVHPIPTPRVATLGAWLWAERASTLLVATVDPNTVEKVLHGFRFTPDGIGGTWTSRLRDDSITGFNAGTRLGIVANERYACVFVSSLGESRIAVVDVRNGNFGGRVLSPSAGKTTFAAMAGTLDGATLFVYGSNASKDHGAWLFSYFLEAEGTEPFWKRRVPFTTSSQVNAVRVAVRDRRLVLTQAYAADEQARRFGSSVTVLPRSAEGEPIFSLFGQDNVLMPSGPVLYRGHLYRVSREGKTVVIGGR